MDLIHSSYVIKIYIYAFLLMLIVDSNTVAQSLVPTNNARGTTQEVNTGKQVLEGAADKSKLGSSNKNDLISRNNEQVVIQKKEISLLIIREFLLNSENDMPELEFVWLTPEFEEVEFISEAESDFRVLSLKLRWKGNLKNSDKNVKLYYSSSELNADLTLISDKMFLSYGEYIWNNIPTFDQLSEGNLLGPSEFKMFIYAVIGNDPKLIPLDPLFNLTVKR